MFTNSAYNLILKKCIIYKIYFKSLKKYYSIYILNIEAKQIIHKIIELFI